MKAIFIDIDGPLAFGTWMQGEVKIETFNRHSEDVKIPYPWVQEDCDALTEILERTGSNLVVSSDWRKFYTLGDLKSIFQNYGIDPALVVDTTIHQNPMKKEGSSQEWDRACEIRFWVRAFKPKHWIAIDDMNLSGYFRDLRIAGWRHVQVDGHFGTGGKLRDKVEECVRKLNR